MLRSVMLCAGKLDELETVSSCCKDVVSFEKELFPVN